MMTNNPEFTRNLWLQISPARLTGAVAVLALVVAVVLLTVSNDMARSLQALSSLASTGLVLVLGLWGALSARATIRDEMGGNTWNQQRMCGLTPWQMTWGKLFGGTAYVWWITLWLIVIFVSAQTILKDNADLLLRLSAWIAMGVTVHALAMIAALGFRTTDGSRVEEIPTGAVVVLVFFALQLAMGLFFERERGQTWFGTYFSVAAINLIVALPFMAWAIVGAHRAIRREMQEPLLPWALPACILTLGFVFTGFDSDASPLLQRGLTISLFITALLTWAAYLVEPHSFDNLLDSLAKLRSGQTRNAALQLSTATVLLALLWLLSFIGAVLSLTTSGPDYSDSGVERSVTALLSKLGVWGYCWLMIVAIRDFLVAHALQRISKTPRRAMGAFVVYLGIVYTALPLALGGAFSQEAVNWWLPMTASGEASGPAGLVGPLLTLGLVIALCARFFRQQAGVAPTAQA